jgi:hypothetical protein
MQQPLISMVSAPSEVESAAQKVVFTYSAQAYSQNYSFAPS